MINRFLKKLCPIGLFCEQLSINEEKCDNWHYCYEVSRPWELQYEFKDVYEYRNNFCFKYDFKALVVKAFLYIYNQEIVEELKSLGWAAAEDLPYYFDRIDKKLTAIVVRDWLRPGFCTPCRLPYYYDLEDKSLIVDTSVCKHSKYYCELDANEEGFENPSPLPYERIYREQENYWELIVIKDSIEDYLCALKLPNYQEKDFNWQYIKKQIIEPK